MKCLYYIKMLLLFSIIIFPLSLGLIKGDSKTYKKNLIKNYVFTISYIDNSSSNSIINFSFTKPPYDKNKHYSINDIGDAIISIQEDLNKFGYNLTVDGLFSNSTFFAVLNFQSKSSIDADGIVGASTFTILEGPVDKNLMYSPRIVSDETISKDYEASIESFINSGNITSKTPYYIYVDTLSTKVNILCSYDGAWHLIKSMSCSVGATSTPTVKGHFEIQGRGPMFRVSSNMICEYFTQFYGGYLFHTVLLDNNGNIIDGRLGEHISHGCIRLSIADAKFINYNIPSGTSVWVK
ncbi:MAG TPA: L,D-transpeptidase family protein [Clostridiaceae bacterium]